MIRAVLTINASTPVLEFVVSMPNVALSITILCAAASQATLVTPQHLADQCPSKGDQLNQLSQRTLASHHLADPTASAEMSVEYLRVLVKTATLVYHPAVAQSARYNN